MHLWCADYFPHPEFVTTEESFDVNIPSGLIQFQDVK